MVVAKGKEGKSPARGGRVGASARLGGPAAPLRRPRAATRARSAAAGPGASRYSPSPRRPLEGLILKLQYLGHLM